MAFDLDKYIDFNFILSLTKDVLGANRKVMVKAVVGHPGDLVLFPGIYYIRWEERIGSTKLC